MRNVKRLILRKCGLEMPPSEGETVIRRKNLILVPTLYHSHALFVIMFCKYLDFSLLNYINRRSKIALRENVYFIIF